MALETVKQRGLVLLGCGKMGSALLAGWLEQGLAASSVWVIDPNPSEWLKKQAATGLHLNENLPGNPAIVLVAVKPQLMGEALPTLTPLGNRDTLFLSVAAGTPISYYEKVLGRETPVIRAMPNTPAAVAHGITAFVGNARADASDLDLAETLLQVVGKTVRLDNEGQIDAVTGVSGSGPAYVFHLIEALAAAGEAEGLPPEMAMQLAKTTVAGAGHLAEVATESPEQLRVNVTSPGGTTAAALKVLMDPKDGFPPLLKRAVHAAVERSRELGK